MLKLTDTSKIDLLHVVGRLKRITNHVEGDKHQVEMSATLLDLFAKEVRFLRETKAHLTDIVFTLMSTLGIHPGSPLGRAALLTSEYGEKEQEQPDYHNKQHVGEVVVASYVLGLREGLDHEQIAELVIAATAHDFSHTGMNNRYDYEREMVAVVSAIPILEQAELPQEKINKIAYMILATDFKAGVPPARDAYLKTRSLPENHPERILATQAMLLNEADILFSCFSLDYNGLLSNLLGAEWKRPGSQLTVKERLSFLSHAKFISRAATDLGLDERRLALIEELKKDSSE